MPFLTKPHRYISILLAITCALTVAAQVGDLPRSMPADQGVDPRAVAEFITAAAAVPQAELHHVMIARHGKVIAEAHAAPFTASDSHTLYSESKTFTAMAVGIAIGENRLRIDDRIATFFPEKLPPTISAHMAQITVRDLLVMASGITPDWDLRRLSSDWLKDWFAKTVTTTPGEKFQYDSMCTFVLSAIVQQVTGRTLLEYLNEKVFLPMHITHAEWEESPDGICTGGWGLRLQAESQLKMGLLLLNRGEWEGKQLIPAQWVDEAILPHINYSWYKPGDAPTDKNQGYGYQLWRCKWNTAFRADGAYGQFIVCVPEADLVVVINQVSEKCYDVLDCVWNKLLPGVKDAPINRNKAQQDKLDRLCNTFSLTAHAVKAIPRQMLPFSILPEPNNQGITAITVDAANRITLDYSSTPGETLVGSPIPARNGSATAAAWVRTTLRGFPPYSIMPLNGINGLKHDFEAAAVAGLDTDNNIVIDIYYVNWITVTTLTISTTHHTVTIHNNCDPESQPEVVSYKVNYK